MTAMFLRACSILLLLGAALLITLVIFDETHPNRPCGEITNFECWK
jgi:hypothetical protein